MDKSTFHHALLLKQRQRLALTRRDVMLQLLDVGVDVTESTLANWEAGESAPDADVLLGLAKVLRVPVMTLLGAPAPVDVGPPKEG